MVGDEEIRDGKLGSAKLSAVLVSCSVRGSEEPIQFHSIVCGYLQ